MHHFRGKICCFPPPTQEKYPMRNTEMKVDGKFLTITIDLTQEGKLSASGKNTVIASTEGNQAIAAGDKVVKVGVNVYTST